MKRLVPAHVKEHPKFGWGITNGEQWFAYAYQDKKRAEKVLKRAGSRIYENLSYPAPLFSERA